MAERLISLSEPELEQALVDLGSHLAYPPTPALAARIRQEIALRPARSPSLWASWLPNQRRLAFAPEARTAVAERLGLRGVLIREVPALPTPVPTATASAATPSAATAVGAASPVVPTVPPSAGARLSLGQPLTLGEVRGRLAFQVPLPGALGPPDEVYFSSTPPGGQVALVYYPRPGLPEANTTGLGLLLTAFQGSVPAGIFGKGIPPGTRMEEVKINGGQGYWIEGDPHTIFLMDNRGQVRPETTRLAGNVLLWNQGELTLRIESALSKDEVLRIATSVH